MQFRSDLSKPVRKLKLHWKVRPDWVGGKKNHLFTILFRESGKVHLVVLEAPPDVMRPYLAEIELKTGRRVDVERHTDY